MSHDKNNVSRFYKNGKNRLPFLHSDHYYPSNWERVVLSVKNKVFDKLYPVRPWIFASIWSASSAYLYLNGQRIPVVLAKLPYNYVIGGLALSLVPVFALRSILHLFLFRYKGYMFEERKSLVTKIWGACYMLWKKLAPKPGLLTCEPLLPRQFVPALKTTVGRYLDSLQPLLSESEFEKLKQLANEFENNQGRKLQRYTWLYSWWTKNYICGFWERFVYLSGRDNLLINSSICSGETLKPPEGATQVTRAAHCAYLVAISMLRYAAREQEPLFEGFMSSTNYTRLYASCRVPAKDIDYWTLHEYSRHLVVIRNGCFYKLECFDPKTNKLYSILDFVQLMEDILNRNDTPSDIERKVAALTLDNRDKWAENRQKFFIDHPTNRKFIEAIESAIVVFVLDDTDYGYQPGNYETVSNLYSNMMLGDGTNRWVDKSIHYMFGSNASCGAFTEHSVADGAEFVVAMEEALGVDAVYLSYPELSKEDLRPRSGLQLAKKLELEIFGEMSSEIERCFTNYQFVSSDLDLSSMVNMNWGKGRIKKTNCSPDAFFQMALQLAYYKDQNEFTSTYEAAAARFFQHTRTETVRTVSKQSCAFVEAMLKDSRDQEQCGRLLREACANHQIKTKMSMTGGGFDRHLFVLYVMSKYLKVDSPFLNEYVKQQWKLSTSQSPLVTNIMKEDLNPINLEQCYYGGCFCAVHKEGYGICYRFIGNHGLIAHITSYHSGSNISSARFRQTLEETLDEMISLFEN